MNFSLHSTTGQSLALLPPGGQDLPPPQEAEWRRLSTGKVVGTGVIRDCWGLAAYFSSTVAGMSKPLKSFFFANPNADIITQKPAARKRPPGHGGREGATARAPRTRMPFLAQVEGGPTIIIDQGQEGTRVEPRGEVVRELGFSAAAKTALTNQTITTESRQGRTPRNATLTREGLGNRGRRIRRGHLRRKSSRRSKAKSSWPNRIYRQAGGPASTGKVSACSRRAMFPRRAAVSEDLAAQEGQKLRARAGAEQEEGSGRLHEGQDGQGASRARSRSARSDEAREEGDLAARGGQGRKAQAQADRGLHDHPPRQRWPGGLCERPQPGEAFMSNTPQVEEGAPRKCASGKRFSACPDISKMQVNTKVHEVAPHQQGGRWACGPRSGSTPYSSELLDGTTSRKWPAPARPRRASSSSDIHKVYSTKVQDRLAAYAGPSPGHGSRGDDPGRPSRQGADRAGAGGASSSTARTTSRGRLTDRFLQTEVELGLSNEKFVEIKKGVKEGDIGGDEPDFAHDRGRVSAQCFRVDAGKRHASRLVQGRDSRTRPPRRRADTAAGGKSLVAGAPVAKGAEAGKGKAAGKARDESAGGAMGAVFAKMKNLSSEDRDQLKSR